MRKRRSRRSWLWAAVPFAVLLLVGCNGGDNGDDTDTTATTEPTTTEPPTVFTRQEIHTLTPEQIDRYRAGVALMQSRNSNATTDPTSWLYQANMHAFPDPDDPDPTCAPTPFPGPNPPEAWGTCQHSSFFFVAWHRMYVYYFERILRAAVREAAGDPNYVFALPYWDYENTAFRDLPEPFRSPADPSNTLFVSARAAKCNNVVAGNPCISAAAASDDVAMDDQHKNFCGCSSPQTCPVPGCVNVFSSDQTFGGGFTPQPEHFGSGPGELEFQPHNAVHRAIGSGGGWMGDPACAARDPIFWLHHANVDRLWQVWLNKEGGRANTTNDTWRNQTFTFFDETKTAVTLTGCQILNMATQLDYQYEGLPVNNVVLCDDGPLTGEAGGPPPPAPKTLASGEAAETRLGARRTSVKVALPQAVNQRILTLAGPDPGRVRLVLEGVKLLRHGPLYEVYLNLPAGATPDPKSPNYVGTVALFDHPEHARELTRSFDVTDEVAKLKAAGQWTGELNVTFVPGEAEQALTAAAGSGPFVSVRKVLIQEQ
ncbi:MAG TPA: tyrosinase family protein [Thermoanaerobaculia bacterium]|nr:tyrosinase family protein [Thermoanaerobaculia bacterium]